MYMVTNEERSSHEEYETLQQAKEAALKMAERCGGEVSVLLLLHTVKSVNMWQWSDHAKGITGANGEAPLVKAEPKAESVFDGMAERAGAIIARKAGT